jgi:GntR family transcriptional repressor for pyruvate dehydrogenase complex
MSEKQVTNKIIAYITKNIQDGTWQLGSKIPSEKAFCEALGVSRISVRSAIQQFIALGILESHQGKGTFIINNDASAFTGTASSGAVTASVKTPETVEEMRDLLKFRALIEPEVCAEVAPSASPELVAKLEALLAVMQRAIKDTNAFVNADMEFHLAICKALRNPILNSIMEELMRQRLSSYQQLNQVVGSYGGIYYHSLIIDALKKHNGKHAYNVMKEHLEHSIDDLSLEA